MSYINVGADAGYLVKNAVNCKSLGTLSNEDHTLDKRQKEKSLGKQINEDEIICGKNKMPSHAKDAKNLIKNNRLSRKEIFNLSGIGLLQSADGSKILTDYRQPSDIYSYKDIGINEEELIKDVTKILGSMILRDSSLESSGDIHTIQGSLVINKSNSKIKDLSSVKTVNGFVTVEACDSLEEAEAYLKEIKFNPKKCGKITFESYGRR